MKILKEIFKSLIKSRSYLNLLLFVLLSILIFVVGITLFAIAIIGVAFVISLVVTIFIYRITEVNFGNWIISSFPEAIVISIIGIILLAILLFIINKLAETLKKKVFIQIGKFKLGNKK